MRGQPRWPSNQLLLHLVLLRPTFVNKRAWEETFERREVGGSHPVHQLDSTKRRGGSLEKELARGARSLIHPLFLQPSNCGWATDQPDEWGNQLSLENDWHDQAWKTMKEDTTFVQDAIFLRLTNDPLFLHFFLLSYSILILSSRAST